MSDNHFILSVECYAGYRGEQTPLRFFIGAREVQVVELLDCWLSPGHRYFKVKGDDEGVYILRHDATAMVWELTHFVR